MTSTARQVADVLFDACCAMLAVLGLLLGHALRRGTATRQGITPLAVLAGMLVSVILLLTFTVLSSP